MRLLLLFALLVAFVPAVLGDYDDEFSEPEFRSDTSCRLKQMKGGNDEGEVQYGEGSLVSMVLALAFTT